MAKKVDTWWDIWLPEEELTWKDLLYAIERSSVNHFMVDFSSLRNLSTLLFNHHNPLEDKLRRIESENVNSKISSGIDLGYRIEEGVIPYIVSESIEENKAYLIDFSKFYTYDNPFRIK